MQVGDHFELATFNSGIWPVSGADLTWNYANEAGPPWGNKDVVDPATAPGYAYFPSATSALQWSVGEFFRSDTAGEDHLGDHISSSEYGICSDPRTDMVYPFTYGDSFTEFLYCSENGPSPRTRTGAFTVTGTGYGTLILPLGTFTDRLLLRRTWSYEDDYGVPDLGYSVGETDYIVQTGIGHPLLSYTTSTYTQGGGIIDKAGGFRLDDLSTGLSSTMNGASHITVRPNPATDEVTVTLSGNGRATLSVLAGDGRVVLRGRTSTGERQHIVPMGDATGRVVLNTTINGATDRVRMDVAALARGCYSGVIAGAVPLRFTFVKN